jgi:hypothetical protein
LKINAAIILNETFLLVQTTTAALSFCRHEDENLPPHIELTPSSESDVNEESMQYRDSLCWDVNKCDVDPGFNLF